MNQDTAQPLDIPTEACDSQSKITTFDGQTAPTGGLFFTLPILLEIGANCHQSMISCRIPNAGKYELIIPFRSWHDEHPLKNIADPSKCVFEKKKCYSHLEDKGVAHLFEWDETGPYDEEAQYVGRKGLADEGGVQLETLPKLYWQYKEPFEEKKAEMVAP